MKSYIQRLYISQPHDWEPALGSQPLARCERAERLSVRGNLRIEGYAIASGDGMIADATGFMPNSLKFEADQRFFLESLDRVQVVCHGRLSHEGDAESPARRRLILTRRVPDLARDP